MTFDFMDFFCARRSRHRRAGNGSSGYYQCSRSSMDRILGFEPKDRGSIPFGSTGDSKISKQYEQTILDLCITLFDSIYLFFISLYTN